MKYVLFLSILLTAVTGCFKDQISPIGDNTLGKWVWQETLGGLDGRTRLTPNAEEETVLQLNADHSFTLTTSDKPSVTGNYSFVEVTSIFSGKPETAIHLTSGATTVGKDQLISLEGNRMTLTDNHVESFRHIYIRRQ